MGFGRISWGRLCYTQATPHGVSALLRAPFGPEANVDRRPCFQAKPYGYPAIKAGILFLPLFAPFSPVRLHKVLDPAGAAHQSASSGKTLLNFTLERGSAIMGATASRQTW